MATFADLKALVATNVIDLPTVVQTNIGSYVNDALVALQNAHDFKVAETLGGPYTTSPSTRVLVAVPSNFRKPRGNPYYVTNLGQVVQMTWAPDRNLAQTAFNIGTTDIGAPQLIVDAEPNDLGARNWEVAPLSDSASDWSGGEYRVYVPYWRYVAALSADGDNNWYTNQRPGAEYIVRMATSYGFFADWDEERGALWLQRAAEKLNEVVKEDKMYRLTAVDTLVPMYKGARSPRVRS